MEGFLSLVYCAYVAVKITLVTKGLAASNSPRSKPPKKPPKWPNGAPRLLRHEPGPGRRTLWVPSWKKPACRVAFRSSHLGHGLTVITPTVQSLIPDGDSPMIGSAPSGIHSTVADYFSSASLTSSALFSLGSMPSAFSANSRAFSA